MHISRLDKIIENNISISTQKSAQEQMIYLLQDISTTLAMIYDRMCGGEPVSEGSQSVSVMAKIIPFEELGKHQKMHFDHVDFPTGYEVAFVRYEEQETFDAKHNEKRITNSVVLDAFGDEMRMEEKDYKKKWRCWDVEPTKEERNKEKWIK